MAVNARQNVHDLKECAAVCTRNDSLTADAVDHCLELATAEINMFFARLEQAAEQLLTTREISGERVVLHLLQSDFVGVIAERINVVFRSVLHDRFGYVQEKAQIVLSENVLPAAGWFLASDRDRRRTRRLQQITTVLAESSVEYAIEALTAGYVGGICKRLNIAGVTARMLLGKAVHSHYLLETGKELRGWLECSRVMVLRQTRKQIIVVGILSILALFVSGALLSVGNTPYLTAKAIHIIASITAAIAVALSIYSMLRKN